MTWAAAHTLFAGDLERNSRGLDQPIDADISAHVRAHYKSRAVQPTALQA
jgi:hypothetical protein